jgi:hypothetical protein
MLVSRLHGAGISRLGDEQAAHALAWYPDDLDSAYDILVLANESIEGELKDFDPNVDMLGAVNRNMVTCYLDALLFAMFARLDSFEAMLYDNFDDEPRKKLSATLRLWVNLLRTGRLIKVELVSGDALPYTKTDQTPPGISRRMRLGRCSQSVPARHVRSLHVYHRRARIASPDPENGHISHWPRKQRG